MVAPDSTKKEKKQDELSLKQSWVFLKEEENKRGKYNSEAYPTVARKNISATIEMVIQNLDIKKQSRG